MKRSFIFFCVAVMGLLSVLPTRAQAASSCTGGQPVDYCIFNIGKQGSGSWIQFEYCGDAGDITASNKEDFLKKNYSNPTNILDGKTFYYDYKKGSTQYGTSCSKSPGALCDAFGGTCVASKSCDPAKEWCLGGTPCAGTDTVCRVVTPLGAEVSGLKGLNQQNGGTSGGGTTAKTSSDDDNAGLSDNAIPLINPLKNTIPLDKPIQAFAARIINAMFGLAGTIALVLFVYGGFVWLLSQGNPKKTQQGKDIFVWTTLGLIMMFSSYVVVNYVFDNLTSATNNAGITQDPGTLGNTSAGSGSGTTLQNNPCTQKGGTCQSTSVACGGVYQQNLCPGSASIQCCVPTK